ncbi:MAG: hypothetical protein R3246_11190, partial [Acidimicrobiia bacterium]|nr:hypothetical protein [Acidimicrobiia bacterium]
SPDGSSLLFAGPATTCTAVCGLPHADRGVWRVRADGTGLRHLVTDEAVDPTWSPDARQIAFGSGQELVVANADGTGMRSVYRLTDDVIRAPSFSPDGRRLAHLVYREGPDGGWDQMDVGIVGVDGRGPTTVLSRGRWAPTRSPQWSPDSTMVAFADAAASFAADVSGRRWTIGSTGPQDGSADYRADPTWSPDGKWIILGAVEQRFEKLRRLHVVRPDGSQLTQLNNGLLGETPHWRW